MRKPRVLLDVDGVLADFLTPSFAILNRLSGLSHVAADLKEWDLFSLFPRTVEDAFYDECNKPGFCSSLPVLPGAVEFVAGLREVADVYIVTSPMNHNQTWTWERQQWLKQHFDVPHRHIVHTSAKYLCVGDVLIDDRPLNIEEWEREHAKGVGALWDAPYNKSSNTGMRVIGPHHALALVKNLQLPE